MASCLTVRHLVQFCSLVCLAVAPVFSQESPVPLELSQGLPCRPEDEGFCLNGGECERITGSPWPRCTCPWQYMGERCERGNLLAIQAMQDEVQHYYIIIAALGGVIVALVAVGVGYAVYRKCGKTETSPESGKAEPSPETV